MVKKSTSINLVKTNKNELVNNIVNWALTIGRTLIIVVEIIALSAFIYRFILDNQLRDINTKIKQEQAILAIERQKETTFRNLQDRLLLTKSIIDQGAKTTKTVKNIISLAPQGINFNNLTYANNQITIQLSSASVFPISIFINSLKTYPLTDYISIDMIENQTQSSSINLGLTVKLKNTGGINENSGN
jgi:hypothetical protein